MVKYEWKYYSKWSFFFYLKRFSGNSESGKNLRKSQPSIRKTANNKKIGKNPKFKIRTKKNQKAHQNHTHTNTTFQYNIS